MMKTNRSTLRILSIAMLVALIFTAMPAVALADSSFSAYVKVGSMRVYRDASLSTYWGSLPEKTIVTVKAYAGDVAKISYNGKTGYAAISDMGTVESIADKAVTTQKTRVYEKPSTSSRYATVGKGVSVNVLAINGSCAMVERNGKVGYMLVSHLSIEGQTIEPSMPETPVAPEPEPEPKPETIEDAFNSGKYSNEQLCFAYATKVMGYNTAAAAGLLANISAESGFRPGTNGDSGRSYGICQWFSSRKTRLINYCADNGLDYTTLYAQLRFLDYELERYYPSVDRYMKNVDNSADGAYDAAYYFCYNFEAPADRTGQSTSRAKAAQNIFYPRYA
ncbi:MAG: phage tail tip lysozyme [Clostridia bacterium]|nr:phage tail tip lysozyme [Clostridia bacterium]